MKAFDILKQFDVYCQGLWSIERINPPTKASNGEMKRWFNNKAVIINGIAVGAYDEISVLESLVLFPQGKRKCTLW